MRAYAMSIATLHGKQRRNEHAHGVLHAAYARFTQGFETADLKPAKQLLDELGGARWEESRLNLSQGPSTQLPRSSQPEA